MIWMGYVITRKLCTYIYILSPSLYIVAMKKGPDTSIWQHLCFEGIFRWRHVVPLQKWKEICGGPYLTFNFQKLPPARHLHWEPKLKELWTALIVSLGFEEVYSHVFRKGHRPVNYTMMQCIDLMSFLSMRSRGPVRDVRRNIALPKGLACFLASEHCLLPPRELTPHRCTIFSRWVF